MPQSVQQKRVKRINIHQRIRLDVTRIFIGVILVMLCISGSRWETSKPMVSAILFLGGCFLVGVASVGRLWCSLYIAGYKTKLLVTQGPYSICRHPLYFFSMLGGAGVGLASETVTVPLLILSAFILYYPFAIRFEENKLRAVFGESHEQYCKTVPRFWPKASLLFEPDEYSVTPRLFRKHILSALWFVWIVGILEIIEELHELNILPTQFLIY